MTRPSLTLLCVTRAEPTIALLIERQRQIAEILGADYWLVVDVPAAGTLRRADDVPQDSRLLISAHQLMVGQGYLETILDRAVASVPCADDDYVLRLDDDESISTGLLNWLANRRYLAAPHWKFARRHFWGTEGAYLTNPPLYPDHQTRLSLKRLSGGRSVIHAGSPHGGGDLAPASAWIGHHKFLVKSLAEREAIAARYDAAMDGGGTGAGLLPFSLPERAFAALTVAEGDA